MVDADRERFRRMLLGVAQTKGRAVDDDGIEAYWRMCSELSIERFERGLFRAATASPYMPDARAILDHAPPPEKAPWEQQRTNRCQLCRDRGYTLEQKEHPRSGLCMYSVPCTCEAGVQWNTSTREWTKRLRDEGRLWDGNQ